MFEVLDPATARDLAPAALVATIESGHREESVLVARRMAAVAALLRHRVAAVERAEQQRGYAVIDGFEQTTAEVAAAMNLSPAGASYLVSYAEALDKRLPHVAALLGEGRTDWRTVRLIISRTNLVADDDLVAKLDQSLAARIGAWHGWSRQRIVNAVDAARERREAAEDDRRIALAGRERAVIASQANIKLWAFLDAARCPTEAAHLRQFWAETVGYQPSDAVRIGDRGRCFDPALYLDAQRPSCPSGARVGVHHTGGFGGGGLGDSHHSGVHTVE
jgi:hypothetical protein